MLVCRCVLASLLMFSLFARTSAAEGGDERVYQFDISKLPADRAVKKLAMQAQYSVLFRAENIVDVETNAVSGKHSVQSALDSLFLETPLQGDLTHGGVIIVSPRQTRNEEGTLSTMNKRKSLLSTASILIGSILGSAQAQDTGPQTESARDTIVVTGSRLLRTDLTAPSPVVTLGEDDIRYDGNVTLEQTLNEFPQLQPSNGTSQTNARGGSGVLAANLRGLGASRTLVLVNGRRFLPASTNGVVDLATIPDALIKQVDILTGGASAVYGSDAVAGAINFTLKNDFEGIEAKVQYGQTFRGDGETTKVDLTIGSNIQDGRGNVVVSGSFTNANPVIFADRDYSSIQLIEADTDGDGNVDSLVPGGSGTIPGTIINLTQSQRAMLTGVDFNPSRPCGNVVGLRFGDSGEPLAACFNEDRFNFSPPNFLSRPRDRWQISAIGRYAVTDRINAYTELFYIDNSQGFQQAPDAFFPRTPGAGPGNFVIPDLANNPAIPQATRDFFIANAAFFDPDGDGDFTITNPGKRAIELGPREFDFDRSSRSFTAGLNGEFDMLQSTWFWDSSFTFQRSTETATTRNVIASRNLNAGLDVVTDPGTGELTCGVVSLRLFSNCVPVNIFGTNSLTPEMASFLTPTRFANTMLERQIATASVAGNLLELPAGPLGTAFGMEWRKDNFEFRPDDIIQNDGAFPNPPNEGGFEVFEVFGEARIPILHDLPFAKELAIEGAGRYSRYSTIGGVITWRASGEWTPVEGVRFRGAYSRAIRAPNLIELFASRTAGFANGDDPCDSDNNPSQGQRDLCIQQGVPAADIGAFQQTSPGVIAVGGGNPGLMEERSNTFTVGAVLRPPALPGFNLAIDYYSVKIENAIGSIGAQTVLDECFRTLDASGQLCGFITRLSDGQVFQVEASRANIAREQVSGIDVQADYTFDVPGLSLFGDDGTVALGWFAGWQFERERTSIEGAPPLDCAGLFGPGCTGTGVPAVLDFQTIFNATYSSGPLSFKAQTRMLGNLKLRENQTAFIDKIGREIYLDLNVRYDVTDNAEIFGGITNVTDNDPPLVGFRLGGPPNTNTGTYDLLGRRFHAGARVRF